MEKEGIIDKINTIKSGSYVVKFILTKYSPI